MKRRFLNFLYNLDRAIASLILGAPAQETISSQWGRRRADLDDDVARIGCKVLDNLDENHCDDAVENADKLNSAGVDEIK